MVSSAIRIMVYNVIGVTRTTPFFVNLLVVLYNALSSYSVHLITLLYPHNFVSFFFLNIYSCRASLEPNQKVSSLLWLQLYILDPSLQKMYNCSKYVFPVSLANSTCHQLLTESSSICYGIERARDISIWDLQQHQSLLSRKPTCSQPQIQIKSISKDIGTAIKFFVFGASTVERDSSWDLDWNCFGNFIIGYARNLSLKLPSLCKPWFCPP